MFRAGIKSYKLARVGLVRAACPRELEETPDNLRLDKAIMIEKNVASMGVVPRAGYTPKCVIVAGAARRKYLLSEGRVHDYAFIDMDAAMDIRADDEISSGELMQKLQDAICAKLLGANYETLGYVPGVGRPYIIEVYPFENYFIFAFQGAKYRQRYFLDPVAKIVRLNVGSQKVEEKFVDASTRQAKPGEITSSAADRMPLVQTGVRYSPAPVAGNDQTSTRGAGNSELVTNIIRNWKNVLEAVEMYLAAIRNGQRKPPMSVPAFAPVNLTPAGKIGQEIAAKGVDVYDFAAWSATEQAKCPGKCVGLRKVA